jgi:hypothetical protein
VWKLCGATAVGEIESRRVQVIKIFLLLSTIVLTMACVKRKADDAFSTEHVFLSVDLKKQVSKPIQAHVEASTLRLLYEAQKNLAKGVLRLPIPDQGVNCEDCGRNLTDEELESNHTCSGCCRVVCKFCSLDSFYRNNGLECLECLKT